MKICRCCHQPIGDKSCIIFGGTDHTNITFVCSDCFSPNIAILDSAFENKE